MTLFMCSKDECREDFEVEMNWNFDNVTCPKCKTEYEVKYDEYCTYDENGEFEGEVGYFYLGDEVKK